MKKALFLVGLVAACLLVARCNEWTKEQDARAFESCREINTDEQCAAWIGRGY